MITKTQAKRDNSLEVHWNHTEATEALLESLPGHWIFCDGGQLSAKNPNPFGITMAFRYLVDGNLKFAYSSVEECSEQYPLTNNDSELGALVKGLCHYPGDPRFPVSICLDSGVTLQRFAHAYNGEPWNRDSVDLDFLRKLDLILPGLNVRRIVLVSGHPTKGQIKAATKEGMRYGMSAKRNWHMENVLCDLACNKVKDAWWAKHPEIIKR